MLTLKRLGAYLLIFLVSLIIIASLTTFWKDLDYLVYRALYLDDASSVELRDKIVLIDFPYHTQKSTYDRVNFRERLADLLDTIGARYDSHEWASAVILDMYFKSDSGGLSTLQASLERLQEKGLSVYAVYDMTEVRKSSFDRHDIKQARVLYENYFTGNRLHTMFQENLGILSYPSVEEYPREHNGHELIGSLPVRVARDLEGEKSSSEESKSYVLPMGTDAEIQSHTYQFIHPEDRTTGGRFTADFDMKGKILLVGSLEQDQIYELEKTGTHLLAWALNDQLKSNQLAKQPLNSPIVTLGSVLFFAGFTALIYALLFKYAKRLQTHPVIIAGLSFITSLAVLMALGLVISATNKVLPVGLALVAITLSAILSGRFAHKFLVTGVAEGAQKYDVFISYSHGNSAWVTKNIYEPLRDARKPNGDKLSIFFDQKSIGIGEAFTSKYMWAIVDSKFFIPIMSEEYYGKNHCRNEMDLAHKRSVEKLLKVLPVAFSAEAVPEIYQGYLYVDTSQNPEFIDGIKKELSVA